MQQIEFKCKGCGKMVIVSREKYDSKIPLCNDCKPFHKTVMRIPI